MERDGWMKCHIQSCELEQRPGEVRYATTRVNFQKSTVT